MKVLASEAFLPGVDASTAVIAVRAIARELEGLYADYVGEPIPEHKGVDRSPGLAERGEARKDPGQRTALIVEDEADLRELGRRSP